MSTDEEWERWGKRDPYFGVLTRERFRRGAMDDAAREEFFESGKIDLGHTLSTIQSKIDPDFSPRTALDFGCGVGRVLVPLAQTCDEVTGLDVSPSMLAEARSNCVNSGITNVTLHRSDDTLQDLTGKFDFLHSLIVFQHIPPERATEIFKGLLHHLCPGGVGMVHFVYSFDESTRATSHPLSTIRDRLSSSRIGGAARRLAKTDPDMQMNPIDLNAIFSILQRAGVESLFAEFREHGGFMGAAVYFQMPEA